MSENQNAKVSIYRCRRCHRTIWVPESIIRGMGPICYGKSYAIRKLLKQGKTREEILEMPKEELKQLAILEIKEYHQTHKKSKKPRKVTLPTIRMKKVSHKKDSNQTSLDIFLNPKQIEETLDQTEEDQPEIESLRKELNDITWTLSKANGWNDTDKALELIGKIKRLEGNV